MNQLKESINSKKPKHNIGKGEWTIGINSKLWIKAFENGVKIRKKGQGELTFEVSEIWDILMRLRKFPKKHAFPILLHSVDLIPIWQKYPETKEFIGKISLDEISDKEKIRIHKDYMNKIKILNELKDKKTELYK